MILARCVECGPVCCLWRADMFSWKAWRPGFKAKTVHGSPRECQYTTSPFCAVNHSRHGSRPSPGDGRSDIRFPTCACIVLWQCSCMFYTHTVMDHQKARHTYQKCTSQLFACTQPYLYKFDLQLHVHPDPPRRFPCTQNAIAECKNPTPFTPRPASRPQQTAHPLLQSPSIDQKRPSPKSLLPPPPISFSASGL